MTMFEVYTQDELRKVSGKNLLETFSNFRVTEKGQVFISFPERKMGEYLHLKDLVEYKYCLPISLGKGGFLFSPYSSYKFITLVLPYLKLSIKKKLFIDSVLEEYKNIPVTIYAAGAIEKAPDHGVGFRQTLKDIFHFTKTKIVDPTDFEYNKNTSSLTEYGKTATLDDYYKLARKVIYGDINAVIDADIIVSNLDQYIGVGTPAETTLNMAQRKPVYGVVANGFDIRQLHPWMFGTITRFFPSFSALRDFIIYPE